jgi:uncharacterized LabA/DUF88 family protein
MTRHRSNVRSLDEARNARSNGPRTLHLIDLENLMGTVRVAEDVHDVWVAYDSTLQLDDADHVVISTGPDLAVVAWFELPSGVRRVVGRGVNGADLALIEVALDEDLLLRRYRRLVIASGDGIFTDTARQYRDAGLEIVQVIGRGGVHPNLAAACDRQVKLPLPPTNPPAAA